MQTEFPSLTIHNLDISGIFASIDEALKAYLCGCQGLDKRVSEAVCVFVIMFLARNEKKFDMHLAMSKKARLLYALLYAKFGVRKYLNLNNKFNKLINNLENSLQGSFDLFANTIEMSHMTTVFSERAHLKSAMCHGDLLKMIPGLLKGDILNPDQVLCQCKMDKTRQLRKNMQSAWFLGQAQ